MNPYKRAQSLRYGQGYSSQQPVETMQYTRQTMRHPQPDWNESDYTDMRSKTPQHPAQQRHKDRILGGNKSKSSPNIMPRFQPSNTAPEDEYIGFQQPATKQFVSGINKHDNGVLFDADESDYADMSGKNNVNLSRNSAASKSMNAMQSKSYQARLGGGVDPKRPATVKTIPRSPANIEAEIREGNFDKDDEGDYDLVPITPTSGHVPGFPVIRTGHNRSDHPDNGAADHRAPTDAGRAARKYLQIKNAKPADPAPNPAGVRRVQSTGLVRSKSRAGKLGGVNVRLGKVQQRNNSVQTFAAAHDDPEKQSTYESIETLGQNTPVIMHTSPPSLKLRSQTMSATSNESFNEANSSDEAFATDKKQERESDGSDLIKILYNGNKSRSLDANYLEWLAKTSPYASRNTSVSNSDKKIAESIEQLKSMSISSNKYKAIDQPSRWGSDSDSEAENTGLNDDEEFQKYTDGVAKMNKDKQAGNSQPVPFISLSAYADIYCQPEGNAPEPVLSPKEMEKAKKKQIKTMKRAKTLRTPSKKTPVSVVEFADVAQAFYDDQQKGKKKGFKSPKKKSASRISLRSRDSFTSGKSPKTGGVDIDLTTRDALSRMPTIKSPLGASPAKRENGGFEAHSEIHYNNGNNRTTKTLDRNFRVESELGPRTNSFSGLSSDGSRRSSRTNFTLPKSGTLGRLFSKINRESRKPRVSDNLFVPFDDADGSKLFNKNPMFSAEIYFKEVDFAHGLSMNNVEDGPQSPEFDVIGGKKTSTLDRGSAGKYATISGYSSGNETPVVPLTTKLSCPQIHVTGAPGQTYGSVKRRPKVFRGSLKRISRMSMHRNTSSDKLELTNGEISITPKTSPAPLRPKIRQKVNPLYELPSARSLATARILYQHLQQTQATLLRDIPANEEKNEQVFIEGGENETTAGTIYQDCAFGHELVTWLHSQLHAKHFVGENVDVTSPHTSPHSRLHMVGMLEVLLEEGLIYHVRRERHFEDSNDLYRFHDDVTSLAGEEPSGNSPDSDCKSTMSSVDSGIGQGNDFASEEEPALSSRSSSIASNIRLNSDVINSMTSRIDPNVDEAMTYLQHGSADALFRKALRKRHEDRTAEELLMIYKEILHIKALANLSDSVKRELAGVLQFESHKEEGKTLFNQGDEGRSWYIIFRGSVQVCIHGKGVVCTLSEGDDFGNLAIINDAPRAASIVLAEKNCHFLKVEKFDFVRILKDVEANTVRLKEHGEDVLILQKIHARPTADHIKNNNTLPEPISHLPAAATPKRQSHRYAISAGTPEKILEHILEYTQPWNIGRREEAMEEFILSHVLFMTSQRLCDVLLQHYRSEDAATAEFARSIKRKVVFFVVRWSHIFTYLFTDDVYISQFVKDLNEDIHLDALNNESFSQLKDDLASLYTEESIFSNGDANSHCLLNINEAVDRLQSNAQHKPIKSSDKALLKVFNLQKTYTTVKLPLASSVDEIIEHVAEKVNKPPTSLTLMELQETGDYFPLPKKQASVATHIKLNSRLFICAPEEHNELTAIPLPNFSPVCSHLELVSSMEVAYFVTQHDWQLVNNVHVMEFFYKICGAHKFNRVTSNLDMLTRRFNQLAYWAPTEILQCQNLNKRVQILRKFIKIAQHLKMFQNMNAFMAVMIGIGNQAVSRLSSTWDKLPAKYKKLVEQFEGVLDPSRNHRNYRLNASTLQPPMIPYLPLVMKDMTFQHEGNDTIKKGLINFEKMHMLSNSTRMVVEGCSKNIEIDNILESTKTVEMTKNYVRNVQVITNQKRLNELSIKIEPRR